MQAVFDGMQRVECVNENGTYMIMPYSFDESIDEITIEADIVETELNRGWRGDLQIHTLMAYDYINGKETDYIVSDIIHDVTLTKIRMRHDMKNVVRWTYIFTKR